MTFKISGFGSTPEFAAMLQLRETLKIIEKHYAEEFERTGYVAAINKEHCSHLPWMVKKRAALRCNTYT
ncbi:MAG: hypothetical protein E7468_07985 [Ruminococcaceae bacterium]|nr:hypothetical protein [Oscillospiraceae bacterium]